MAQVNPAWCSGIVDLSHHQKQVVDWAAAKDAGIVAAIHKATESDGFHDAMYHKRRHKAKAAGLLWGGYHFSGPPNIDGRTQADYFLDYAEPEPDDFICFDCEKHGTLANMEAFVTRVHERLSLYPAIYGRRLLRELMKNQANSVAASGVLWYDEYPGSQYSLPQQDLPTGWANWTLWQFTDGHHGCEPRATSGIGNCDRSVFAGSAAELRQAWPF